LKILMEGIEKTGEAGAAGRAPAKQSPARRVYEMDRLRGVVGRGEIGRKKTMRARILCLDAATGLEKTVKRLRVAGCEVMVASSEMVALALLRLFPPDLVLVHSQAAETLLPRIRRQCPALPVVVTGEDPLAETHAALLASLAGARPDRPAGCSS